MLELQGRRKLRRAVYSKTTLIILGIVLLFLIKSVWGAYEKKHVAKYYYDQSTTELVELGEQKSRLDKLIARLSTSRGIEEEVRKNFSVASAGEHVITVVEPTVKNASSSEVVKNKRHFWATVRAIWD